MDENEVKNFLNSCDVIPVRNSFMAIVRNDNFNKEKFIALDKFLTDSGIRKICNLCHKCCWFYNKNGGECKLYEKNPSYCKNPMCVLFICGDLHNIINMLIDTWGFELNFLVQEKILYKNSDLQLSDESYKNLLKLVQKKINKYMLIISDYIESKEKSFYDYIQSKSKISTSENYTLQYICDYVEALKAKIKYEK